MFRMFKTVMALSALLALAACNSVTAPVVTSNDDAASAQRDSKRNDHEFVAVGGDEFSPLPDEGGGTGNRYGDQQEERDSADRGKRVGQEVIAIGDEFTPLPDDGGGAGSGGPQPQQRESAEHRSNRNAHEWTPAQGEGTGGSGALVSEPPARERRAARRARGQEISPVK